MFWFVINLNCFASCFTKDSLKIKMLLFSSQLNPFLVVVMIYNDLIHWTVFTPYSNFGGCLPKPKAYCLSISAIQAGRDNYLSYLLQFRNAFLVRLAAAKH